MSDHKRTEIVDDDYAVTVEFDEREVFDPRGETRGRILAPTRLTLVPREGKELTAHPITAELLRRIKLGRVCSLACVEYEPKEVSA